MRNIFIYNFIFEGKQLTTPLFSCSKYQLNISPQYSEVTLCVNEERRGYEKLLHCSMHRSSEILNLVDIIYNSQNAEGLSVNLLVAVRGVRIFNILSFKLSTEKIFKRY